MNKCQYECLHGLIFANLNESNPISDSERLKCLHEGLLIYYMGACKHTVAV